MNNQKKILAVVLGFVIFLATFCSAWALEQDNFCTNNLNMNLSLSEDVQKCADFWGYLTNSTTTIYNITNITEITLENITEVYNVTNITYMVGSDNITVYNITNTTIVENHSVNFQSELTKGDIEKMIRDELTIYSNSHEEDTSDKTEEEKPKGALDYIFSPYGVIMLTILALLVVVGRVYMTKKITKVHDPDHDIQTRIVEVTPIVEKITPKKHSGKYDNKHG